MAESRRTGYPPRPGMATHAPSPSPRPSATPTPAAARSPSRGGATSQPTRRRVAHDAEAGGGIEVERKGALVWNARGILTRGKIEYLRDYTKMNNPYIVAIVETHLNKDIEAAEIKIDNYELFRADRKDRSHGGVVLYVRKDIPAVLTLSFSNSVCEALAVKVKVLDLMIAILYRPPASGLKDFDEMIKTVKNVFEEDDTPNKLWAGDLNFPWLDWKLNDGRNEATLTSKAQDKIQSNILLDAMEEMYLSNYSREPTRAQNVLDLVMTNNPDMVIDLTVTACAHLSDHNQLEFEMHHHYMLPKMLKKE